jgi:hypothetical protein
VGKDEVVFGGLFGIAWRMNKAILILMKKDGPS